MTQLHDKYGRPLDDLDVLKFRVHAQSVAQGGSYTVVTKDGTPICGFVADGQQTPPVVLVNTQFS